MFSLSQYFLFFTIIALFPGCRAAGQDEYCNISRCGDDGPTIRFPFWLKNMQPERCGYPGFELSCNEKNQTVLELPKSVKLVVSDIDYIGEVIRAYNPYIYSCLPQQLLSLNLSTSFFSILNFVDLEVYLFNCSPPARNIQYSVPCLSVGQYQVYAINILYGNEYYGNEYYGNEYLYELTSCIKIGEISRPPFDMFSFYQGDLTEISNHQKTLYLTWTIPYCSKCKREGKMCNIKKYNTTAEPEVECLDIEAPSTLSTPSNKSKKPLLIKSGLVIGTISLVLVVIALYCAHTSHKTKKDDQVKVDRFLEDYKAQRPTRYTFADVKKITNQFKEKLGEGGHGTVFKGKLSSEIFVAVKVLNESVENGDDFINEVGTMGTIHHVNVVRLVGFCADGINRALVYEFLPNDSLEKFLFSKKREKHFLGWEKLQDIALGISKGIEYLHQGCEQRILHFDIKPHNILLDNNFNPKIADFGLAKLCSKDQSIVSMTAARGTLGYIAPEVFSRNFGNVSYKSDVYSFGMMLLEMVGGRKNIDVTVQNTSQVYFPEWIYNRLCQGQELGIIFEEEEHAQIAKRLTIIGLWCIQWNPIDRPSIKTVVQMLEGKGSALVMPPNPFASTVQRESSSRPARVPNRELAVISEAE